MNILETIVAHKRAEVAQRKELYPVKYLEQSIFFPTQPLSLKKYLLRENACGIIAEFKRRSPSKGVINAYADVERTTIGYMQAGASALSVLTDSKFFGGSSNDLITARKFNFCPILRKDFIIDEYQVIESKSIGADVILLIAAVLDPKEVNGLTALAHSLGLEVLLEVHGVEELEANLKSGADLVGVNNRNLKTLEVDLNISKSLAPLIPDGVIKISESGIADPNAIHVLREYGFKGFLMGEHFMKDHSPEKAAMEFIESLVDGRQSIVVSQQSIVSYEQA